MPLFLYIHGEKEAFVMRRKNRVTVIPSVCNIRTIDPEGCPTLCDTNCTTGNSCTCYIPAGVCGSSSIAVVSNADVCVKRMGNKTFFNYKPSKNVQFTIITSPVKGKIVKRVFRTQIKNKNRRRAYLQFIGRNGTLTSRKIPLRFSKCKRCTCGR